MIVLLIYIYIYTFNLQAFFPYKLTLKLHVYFPFKPVCFIIFPRHREEANRPIPSSPPWFAKDFMDCTGPLHADWQLFRQLFRNASKDEKSFPELQQELMAEAYRLYQMLGYG